MKIIQIDIHIFLFMFIIKNTTEQFAELIPDSTNKITLFSNKYFDGT